MTCESLSVMSRVQIPFRPQATAVRGSVPMLVRGSVLLLGALILAWALLMPAPATAQPCSSDSQCRDFGRTRTYCAGNTLVTQQSRCIGSCTSVEISRIPCPGPCAGDRCVGGSLRSSPSEPSYGGGLVGGACAQICTCRGKQLTYGVGVARTAAQCRRRNVDCKYGCTCDPEPRCLKRDEV